MPDELAAERGAELYLSAEGYGKVEKRADGLWWGPCLPEGRWLKPGPDGRPTNEVFTVVAGRSDLARNIVGLEDVTEAYRDGAVQHVTLPKTHADRVDENLGFVEALEVQDGTDPENGRPVKVLHVGMRFTEPEAEAKQERGSIANRSAGLLFGYTRKRADQVKRWPVALGHVCLTNKPWVTGMAPFGAGLAEDAFATLTLSDDVPVTGLLLADPPDLDEVRAEVCDALDAIGTPGDWELVAIRDGATEAIVADRSDDLYRVAIGRDQDGAVALAEPGVEHLLSLSELVEFGAPALQTARAI